MITNIRHGFLTENLFDSWSDADTYDHEASARKYADMVKEQLQERFPSAEIEIVWQNSASGSLPTTLKTTVSSSYEAEEVYREEEAAVEIVEVLAGRVYEGFGWMVEL